jgi:Tat protein translocase TatC
MVSLDDPAVRAAYDDEQLPRMSFGDHLDELRRRLIRALLAIAVAVGVVMPFKTTVTNIVLEPYRLQWRQGFLGWERKLAAMEVDAPATGVALDTETQHFLAYIREHREAILAGTTKYPWLLPQNTGYPVPYHLHAIGGLEEIMAFMWTSLLFALVLAAPVVIWQVWAFIAAGLYQRERTAFYRFFPFMMVLLAAGVAFGYFVGLPVSLGFLIGMMDPAQVTAVFSIGQYLNLLFGLTAAMGLMFQLPLVMLALQRVGLMTHAGYIKHWRITILVIFLVAAIVTPPEPVSMMMMASPMMLLYVLGLLLTRFGRRHEAPAEAAS